MPLNWRAAVSSGIVAGVVATGAQIFLWRVFTDALPHIFYRDARFTAAILLGQSVLPPPATFDWKVIIIATVIHFVISIVYSLILARVLSRIGTVFSLLAGSLYGLLIYTVNMYGATAFFPWFSEARDWITVVTHIVFGISLAGTYKVLSRTHFP
ncbi:sodium:proline symporter [Nitrosospira sp. Nsp1]|uniref:sodium:proline symporter n=1 Tax=Nitrosospira sp. Nsp1 TaxID=136547 RepID=UPI0008893929|nr:sodium:proline symporter [Nitrosospira sp. Nsp1]SCX53630.1 hypothetical protein SAMN05720354_11320 [Nitrosospira sp. Nsp1]